MENSSREGVAISDDNDIDIEIGKEDDVQINPSTEKGKRTLKSKVWNIFDIINVETGAEKKLKS